MPYSNVLAEITGGKWAITADGLRSILAIANREYSAEDYSVFHSIKEEEKEALVADLGTRVQDSSYSYVNKSTGIMYLDGPIIPRGTWMSDVSGLTSIDTLTKEFMAFEADESIRNIVLLMDTPGGNVVGVSEFSQMVRNSNTDTTAFVYGMAASAGYWIASAADRIFSVDTGEVGSIGVVATYSDPSNKESKTIEIVSSQSPNKRPDITSEEGRASIQEVVDDLADVFVETVASNRGRTPEQVIETFGAGGMSVAKKAEGIGMIDGITTLTSLLNELDSGSAVTRQSFSIDNNNNPKKAEESMSDNDALDTTAEETTAVVETPATDANDESGGTSVVADPAVAERTRIQAIEALGDGIGNLSAVQQRAAREVINGAKYEGSETAETVAPRVLAAVNKAAGTLTSTIAADASETATHAEEIPSGSEDETQNTEASNEAATIAGVLNHMPKN